MNDDDWEELSPAEKARIGTKAAAGEPIPPDYMMRPLKGWRGNIGIKDWHRRKRTGGGGGRTAQRLRELKQLLDEGLIDQEDYEKRSAEILREGT